MILNVVESLPNLGTAIILVLLGVLLARFLSRAVLISAVNMQIQSARLLSLAVKWLVLVFAAAMALDHLRVGADIVRMGFAILFGGIVLAVALAIGLGSKDSLFGGFDGWSAKRCAGWLGAGSGETIPVAAGEWATSRPWSCRQRWRGRPAFCLTNALVSKAANYKS